MQPKRLDPCSSSELNKIQPLTEAICEANKGTMENHEEANRVTIGESILLEMKTMITALSTRMDERMDRLDTRMESHEERSRETFSTPRPHYYGHTSGVRQGSSTPI
uniref:Uncharacterized protein n=1 Tax=Solanum tuberosum TaxID=4113 RepID=M1DGQ5_SOLTU